MSKKYTFREITEKDELEKFFRLRYEVYSKCKRMNPFIKYGGRANYYNKDIGFKIEFGLKF